jgi:hypothetical protein
MIRQLMALPEWEEYKQKLRDVILDTHQELLDEILADQYHDATITAGKILMLMDLLEFLPEQWAKEEGIENGDEI